MRSVDKQHSGAVAFAISLALGILVGFVSWGEGRSPALAVLVPIVWMMVRSPLVASAWVVGYYFVSMRGIVSASDVFFGDIQSPFWFGVLLWSSLCSLLCLPWIVGAFCRQKWRWSDKHQNGLLAVAILFISIIPPLGIISGASPILSVGWILPGSSWSGLVAYATLLLVFPYLRFKHLVIAVLAGVCAVLTPHENEDHSTFDNIRAISTNWGKTGPVDTVADRISAIAARAKQEARAGVKAVVYPEGILGDWTDSYKTVWDLEVVSASKTYGIEIGVGANIEARPGVWNNSLLVQRGRSGDSISARQTVPVSMYQPWHDAGYPADWTRSTSTTLAGHSVMVLFCYEEHLPGIVLSGILRKRPEVLLSVSNAWWGRESVVPVVQVRHAESMSRLFGIPLLRAENR